MPYARLEDLPPEVKKLPEHAQRIFLRAFNSAFKKYRSEERAFKIAWSAVKQVYVKTENSWEKKKSFDNTLVFSKSFESFKSDTSDDFYVEGYIETPGMDILGDVCTKECLDDINLQLIDAVVKAKIGREHEHSIIDRDLLHVAKVVHSERDENGVLIKARLNKYHPDFECVKGSIEEGMYDAFSIEYFPELWTEDVITDDGEYIPRRLEKILLTGITFTGKPVNSEAVITNFGHGLIKSQAIANADEEMKAVWSAAYINELPDDSFAYISNKKRYLPYKDKKGKIDIPHLRKALVSVDQLDFPDEVKSSVKRKLINIAKGAGIGEKKSFDQEEKNMTENEEIKKPVEEETKPTEDPVETPAAAEKAPEENASAEVNKEKEEVKSTTESEEVKALKDEIKALKEQKIEEIKSLVLEELKSIQPEQKNLVDTSEKKFENKEEIKSDVVSQVARQLGYKGE